MRRPEESIGFLLSDTVRLMRTEFNRRLRQHGITLARDRKSVV